jgi:2-dehydro-3-deoxyphosphogluconate aldolase/(4S)-4-hydroxy-2-oxoglutarate aldolase
MKTTDQELFWNKFRKMPLVGIARGFDPESLQKILPLFIEAGFQNIEITMNSANAAFQIKETIAQYGNVLNIGAGTVCTMEDLEKAVHAGAQFIVTPIVNEELIRSCHDAKIPVFPGAFTATEIYKAWQAGADMVKLFPFSSLQPAFLQDIAGPFPKISLMPTGGVGIHNCKEVFEAGAAAIGVGGQLFNKKMISAQNWKDLSDHFKLFAGTITEAIHPHF